MERILSTSSGNRILLAIFSTITIVSMILMLFQFPEFSLLPGNSRTADFQMLLTTDFIIIKKPYTDIITSYIKSGSSISTGVFPLELPRFIKTEGRTISIRMWDFKIPDLIRLKSIEIEGRNIVQRVSIVDLMFHLREEGGSSNSSSHFKLSFEEVEKPHEFESDENQSGYLNPLTGHLYGGFYSPPESKIELTISWEPVDIPILIIIYHESGKSRCYSLTGGKWSGSLEIAGNGLNCLIIGNPNQSKEISYYGIILNRIY
jgi:hypothetical protein